MVRGCEDALSASVEGVQPGRPTRSPQDRQSRAGRCPTCTREGDRVLAILLASPKEFSDQTFPP